MTRKRGFADYNPTSSTRELLAQVDAILEEYADHLPLTIRQIFYRLVGAFDYPKSERAYSRLTEKLNRARRAQMIPFSSIRDDGVETRGAGGYRNAEAFWAAVEDSAKRYRRDRLQGQPVHPEVWVEAGGMVPQVARVVSEYGVTVYSSGGFDSLTTKHEAAQRMAYRDRQTVVLQIGDYDPSGVSMHQSAAEDIRQLVDGIAFGAKRPKFRRVAVTMGQIDEYDLPGRPPKTTDKRAQWRDGDPAVQCEALSPSQLADEVEAAVTDVIDVETFESVKRAEQRDRTEILEVVKGMQSDG